jgi:dTDP-4-amino-4,6-dideoxygalactose transaminase
MMFPNHPTGSAPSPVATKKASNPANMRRPILAFRNARSAFKALLQEIPFSEADEILLPAYIGWSKNEGSGVFDPVRETGVRFRFYRLARDLSIDLDDLRAQLHIGRPRLVVFIHYFGWPDVQLAEAVTLAREYGSLVLEDEAHALYSDWVSGICGRLGDAAIFSLHKMLPFNSGGWLVLNQSLAPTLMEQLVRSSEHESLPYNPLDYDWHAISMMRRKLARQWLELLQPCAGQIDPLFPGLREGVIPQTLPVVVLRYPRNDLYFQMNEQGFGVVSLYHTLIDEIQADIYPDSHWLAEHIMNLPVHQDITEDAQVALLRQLARIASS